MVAQLFESDLASELDHPVLPEILTLLVIILVLRDEMNCAASILV